MRAYTAGLSFTQESRESPLPMYKLISLSYIDSPQLVYVSNQYAALCFQLDVMRLVDHPHLLHFYGTAVGDFAFCIVTG